jgi:hypothetical protein
LPIPIGATGGTGVSAVPRPDQQDLEDHLSRWFVKLPVGRGRHHSVVDLAERPEPSSLLIGSNPIVGSRSSAR